MRKVYSTFIGALTDKLARIHEDRPQDRMSASGFTIEDRSMVKIGGKWLPNTGENAASQWKTEARPIYHVESECWSFSIMQILDPDEKTVDGMPCYVWVVGESIVLL